MLFSCLFYIRCNLSGYTFSIKLYIVFLKGNITFFQAVRVVCLSILQGFFSIFIILIFSFISCHCSSMLRILRIASLPKYIPVVVYSEWNNKTYFHFNVNKNRIIACSVEVVFTASVNHCFLEQYIGEPIVYDLKKFPVVKTIARD